MESSENGIDLADDHILNLLDSVDSYLILVDNLSSALRQGWLELASARHSMGACRVNSTLFDHKSHHASTTLQLHHAEPDQGFLPFTLCKWTSSEDKDQSSEEAKFEEDALLQNRVDSPKNHQELHDNKAEDSRSPVTKDNHVVAIARVDTDDRTSHQIQAQKERSKSLSMFGTLVSPKLRATQVSFEKALETMVEIANVRASLLRAYDQVQKDVHHQSPSSAEGYES